MLPLISKIPAKKSKDSLEAYQKYGPYFNKVLWNMYQQTIAGTIVDKHAWAISASFDKYCQADNPSEYITTQHPFAREENIFGDKFYNALCLSINDVIAHGRNEIPITGDICSVDYGLSVERFNFPTAYQSLFPKIIFDSAFTARFNTKPIQNDWINTPLEALKNVVALQPKDTMEIAEIIHETANLSHLKQVISLTGHGIGRSLHEAPAIYNAPGKFKPVKLFNGMCFCIEPMFIKAAPGNRDKSFISPTYIGEDGWKIQTVSGESASHFETVFCVIDGKIVDVVGVTEWDL